MPQQEKPRAKSVARLNIPTARLRGGEFLSFARTLNWVRVGLLHERNFVHWCGVPSLSMVVVVVVVVVDAARPRSTTV